MTVRRVAAHRLRFQRAFSALECPPPGLPLFQREICDLSSRRCSKPHVGPGVGVVLLETWEHGIVLRGISARMSCWFNASVLDSFASDRLAALPDGLGLLSGSPCPHF